MFFFCFFFCLFYLLFFVVFVVFVVVVVVVVVVFLFAFGNFFCSNLCCGLKKSKTDFLRYIGYRNFINGLIKHVSFLILVHVRILFCPNC